MTYQKKYDSIVIGSGPNGLAAAICLVQKGQTVKIFERENTIGGGTRTRELTLPGFRHDVCSAIHPMATVSPFLQSLPLQQFGLEWIYPDYPLVHPLENKSAVVLHHSLEKTATGLGPDKKAYQSLFAPIVKEWANLSPWLLGPFSLFFSNPLMLARFGRKALRSAKSLASATFETDRARALFAGLAAHSTLPLDEIATSAIGLVLGAVAHHTGWPIAKGGSQTITNAMASYFESLGGEIETGIEITSLNQLPASSNILFNTTPKQILAITDDQFSQSYARKLKSYTYGAGVFKLDLALDDPIPWKDPACTKAGTVHLGGTFEEIVESEKAVTDNRHPEKPYVLVAQQSLFDDSRAPEDKHTAWAYCHVPNGSIKDMSGLIINQIERFAPGTRDLIISHSTMNTHDLQSYNPNYIGGDINGGRQGLTQLFTRPAGLFDPYHIPGTSMYICSSSTPPGGGVHGMCGYHAAQSLLRFKSYNF